MGSIIGIDLGTTFSAVARFDETGNLQIVPNAAGSATTPSCIARIDGALTVGEPARREWGTRSANAAARFKRDMGTSRTHAIGKGCFTPTQLSTLVLEKLASDTADALGTVDATVVTVPANFSNAAREATMEAARKAGLSIDFLINEPTAVALYYAYAWQDLQGTYVVYDLGGGTFDVSVISVDGSDVEVLASNGVARLGGMDFDEALLDIVRRKYHEASGEVLSASEFTLLDAEQLKRRLSFRREVDAGFFEAEVRVSRKEFEAAIDSSVHQTRLVCEQTMGEANLTAADIHGVFLAGGSTRIPLVKRTVRDLFEQDPISEANVDEVVALGAALYAGYRSDRKILGKRQRRKVSELSFSEITNKCFGTLSLRTDSPVDPDRLFNVVLIPKGTTIPCRRTDIFSTRYDGQEAVRCSVTESTRPETDPEFVNVIWDGGLRLPAERPANQEILVTFAYDENQIMKCSFVDVETGRSTEVELNLNPDK